MISPQDKQQLLKQYQLLKSVKPQNQQKISTLDRAKQLLNKKKQQKYLKASQQRALQSILGHGKPSKDDIYKSHKGLKEINYVKKQYNEPINSKSIAAIIQQGYKYGIQNNKSPDDIWSAVIKGNTPQRQLFDKLKAFTGSYIGRQKLKTAAYGKVRKQISDKFKIPLHDADIIILLDDFYDFVGQQSGYAKNIIQNNADKLYPILQSITKMIFPNTLSIAHQLTSGSQRMSSALLSDQILKSDFKQLSGQLVEQFHQKQDGSIQSQDPYAISANYIKYLYGGPNPHPCPRYQNQYMYQMTTRMQVPVTTAADGSSIISINPAFLYQPGVFAANGYYLPFVNVSNNSSANIYASAPAYSASPFNTQYGSVAAFALDALMIDFIQTQSPLNVKGKLQTSFFYEAPNQSWLRSSPTNVFNTTTLSITDTDITNNIGYVTRKTCHQCMQLTRLGTWIPQQDKLDALPVTFYDDNITINQQGCVIIKFTGCTPSTNIGTMWITVSASIQPVAQMRGILTVTPRGTYQGTFRAFKQSRKNGIPLEFLSFQQAKYLYKHNFKQVQFNQFHLMSSQLYGQGKINIPQGYQLLYDPADKQQNYCVYNCLTYLGYDIPMNAKDSLKTIFKYPENIYLSCNGQIIYHRISNQWTRTGLLVDMDVKHVVVVQYVNHIQANTPFQRHTSKHYNSQEVIYKTYNVLSTYTPSAGKNTKGIIQSLCKANMASQQALQAFQTGSFTQIVKYFRKTNFNVILKTGTSMMYCQIKVRNADIFIMDFDDYSTRVRYCNIPKDLSDMDHFAILNGQAFVY